MIVEISGMVHRDHKEIKDTKEHLDHQEIREMLVTEALLDPMDLRELK